MFGCVGIIGIYSGFLWQVLSCPILYKRFPLIFSSTKGSRWSSKISMTSKISPWEYRRYRSSQVPSVFVRARCSHSCVFRRGSCAQPQRPGPDNEETIYSHPVSYLMVLWLMCSLYIYISIVCRCVGKIDLSIFQENQLPSWIGTVFLEFWVERVGTTNRMARREYLNFILERLWASWGGLLAMKVWLHKQCLKSGAYHISLFLLLLNNRVIIIPIDLLI